MSYTSNYTGLEIDAGIEAANAAVPRSGGAMTGPLLLHDAPTEEKGAVTKKYVDDAISTTQTIAQSRADTAQYKAQKYADDACDALNTALRLYIQNQDGSTLSQARDYTRQMIPVSLPNPNALTFKGAASGTYDGSAPLEITIPEGGGNGSTIIVEQETPLFASSIEGCTDTTKVYVLPDGYIYAYIFAPADMPEITITGETGGYYYADEWNPTGKLQSSSSCSAKRTNLIPVTPGDVLNYKGNGVDAVYSVFWLDSSKTYLNREQIKSTSSYTSVTVPSGAAYVWFGSFEYTTSISSVVLDVQWVTCQAAVSEYHWTNTGHAFVSSGNADVLNGKKIVYDGDSICMGYNAGGGYPALIAELTNGTCDNQAVGGGLLTASSSVHSVVNNLANLPTDGDIYCFQGGINDYWGNVALGTCTQGDYTGTLDTSTICGALETIFRYALSNFVGKSICFVITHKIQKTAYQNNSAGHSFKDYRDAMVQVCEKYSIPYYDAFSESGLNGWNDAQNNTFLTGNGAGTPDGTHPNAEGYKRYYVPQLLDLFRRIIPITV